MIIVMQVNKISTAGSHPEGTKLSDNTSKPPEMYIPDRCPSSLNWRRKSARNLLRIRIGCITSLETISVRWSSSRRWRRQQSQKLKFPNFPLISGTSLPKKNPKKRCQRSSIPSLSTTRRRISTCRWTKDIE